jgi:uncharacterized protein (DUF342 family)
MGKPPDEKIPKADLVDQCPGDGWRLLLLVSLDRLTASVQLVRSIPGAVCPPEKVVEFVRGSQLRLGRDEDARLPELARTVVGGASAVVVAKGSPAETWKDIEWLIPIGISLLRDYSDETVDLHEVSQFINVRAGQVLCEVPPPPKDGCSVFGQSIPAQPCPFQLGDRVGLDPHNPSRVIAAQAGCVRFVNGRLSVEQHLEIPGDLNFKTGNIDFFGDVIVHGNVLDGFHIKSAKSIVIDGAVGVATLEAGGNLTIKGGVNGGHKGRLVSGGDLQAHYLHMVSVECGGDAVVDIECHDSTVVAMGSVIVSRGGIIGGKVLAGTDISAGFLGAEMCVPTTVHAGYQPGLDVQVEKARKNLAQALALVKNLESALARCAEQPGVVNRYPSQRKTQMIQYQTRLGDARLLARRALTELSGQMSGAALVGATIASAKQVFPKVTLVIDSVCEEEVTTEIAGPVRLALDRDRLATKVVARRR